MTAAAVDILAAAAPADGDPEGRRVALRAGCALFDARVTLAAAGFDPRVEVQPDRARPDLLARVTRGAPRAHHPLADYAPLVATITDHRPRFTTEVVPGRVLRALAEAAEAEATHLVLLNRLRQRRLVAGLALEPVVDAPGVVLLETAARDAASWLAAGQALRRILLQARRCGYAAASLAVPIGAPATDDALRSGLQLAGLPAAVLVVGRAAVAPQPVRRPAPGGAFADRRPRPSPRRVPVPAGA